MSKNNQIIAAVVGVVLIGGAFYGGMQYQKAQAPAAGQGRTFTGVPGAGGARTRGGAGFANGDILSKDTQSLTIKLANGGSQIVFLSASTTVMKATAGALADLSQGVSVTAIGTPNPDGSMTAQSVQIRPAGMRFPGAGRGPAGN